MDGQMLSKLFDIKAVKFGQFTMKTGLPTPIYVDLRSIVSYPDLLQSLAKAMWQKKTDNGIACDVLCGVPYTALPIATAISVENSFPMVMRRKEAKTYGTKKIIEGVIKYGQNCLIIEDIVSSGSSVLETAEVLRKEGLIVTDCIVVVNREQGGEKSLKENGITLHSLYTLSMVVSELEKLHLVSESMALEVKHYLKCNNQIVIPGITKPELSYSKLSDSITNSIGKKLLKTIKDKRTNLCVAVDTEKSSELLVLAEELGPHICMLKTHIDILLDFEPSTVSMLKDIAKKHGFLIMEDRKFADIGNTVALQYKSGVYKIKEWADIVTVHSIPGEGVIEALKQCESTKDHACVLVAEMSSEGTLTTEAYKEQTLKMARNHQDFVAGFVSQSKLCDTKFLHMCPGVNLNISGDSLGQKYKTPEIAIKENGADIIIVGRAITKSKNRLEAALLFKNRGFDAYREVVNDI